MKNVRLSILTSMLVAFAAFPAFATDSTIPSDWQAHEAVAPPPPPRPIKNSDKLKMNAVEEKMSVASDEPVMPPETLPARIAAATEYAKAVPVENMINDMMGQAKKNPKIGITDAEAAYVKTHYDYERLSKIMINQMAKYYTEDEIKAMTAFFGSPTGREILRKMPAYMASFTPYVQQQSMETLTDARLRMPAQLNQIDMSKVKIEPEYDPKNLKNQTTLPTSTEQPK